MLKARGKLPTSNISALELNKRCQLQVPLNADLVLSGYGEGDFGWKLGIFQS
jgi:hypothetical protein